MPLDAWLALIVVIAVFPLMAFARQGPDIVLLGAVILLLTLGVIEPDQALAGFSSSGLFTVAFMYVLVASIRETGGIDLIIRYVLGRPRGEFRALIRLLMPLSFASILGGTITLFGTSTNLVVHGLLIDREPRLAMGLFDIAWVGVPVAVVGLMYLILLGPRMLPARRGAGGVALALIPLIWPF